MATAEFSKFAGILLFSEHLFCVGTVLGTWDAKMIQADMDFSPRELMVHY